MYVIFAFPKPLYTFNCVCSPLFFKEKKNLLCPLLIITALSEAAVSYFVSRNLRSTNKSLTLLFPSWGPGPHKVEGAP